MIERGVDLRMRIAFRQQATERGDVHEPIERVRGIEKASRGEIEPLHRVMTQMLVEPCPPGDADAIARLQHGRSRAPAAPRTRPR